MRHFLNPFVDELRAVPSLTAEAVWQQVQLYLPELDECLERASVPKSTGRWQRRYEAYTGLAGIGLAYLRLAKFCRDVQNNERASRLYAEKALVVARACLSAEPTSDCISFFCGTPGYLALAAASSFFLGDEDFAEDCVKRLLEWCPLALEHAEDELLFGRAGYLYAVLWVRNNCKHISAHLDVEGALRCVANLLVCTGQHIAQRHHPDWPLMWYCFNEPYLGAAHGVVGVLAMLFHCYGVLKVENQQLVQATLQKLLSIRFRSGNMPIILGESCDEHVHWCHGAPGLIALLNAAIAVLGDTDGILSRAVQEAGNVVWQRGVILKGNGLCHGISGNAYTFLSIYRLTGDTNQLKRAEAFATLLTDKRLQQAIRQHHDPQRCVCGIPDSPRSLMEGSAGVVCFLLDCANPTTASFPGWEM